MSFKLFLERIQQALRLLFQLNSNFGLQDELHGDKKNNYNLKRDWYGNNPKLTKQLGEIIVSVINGCLESRLVGYGEKEERIYRRSGNPVENGGGGSINPPSRATLRVERSGGETRRCSAKSDLRTPARHAERGVARSQSGFHQHI